MSKRKKTRHHSAIHLENALLSLIESGSSMTRTQLEVLECIYEWSKQVKQLIVGPSLPHTMKLTDFAAFVELFEQNLLSEEAVRHLTLGRSRTILTDILSDILSDIQSERLQEIIDFLSKFSAVSYLR